MASLALSYICCNNTGSADMMVHWQTLLEKQKVLSIISLISATISTVCIIVIALNKKTRFSSLSKKTFYLVQSDGIDHVTKCIVIAGILANTGLIVRSIAWICNFSPLESNGNNFDGRHVLCIVSTVWIQYFFGSIMFWHLVYGLEIYVTSKESNSSRWAKYLLGWAVPSVICFVVLWLTYHPSLNNCGTKSKTILQVSEGIMLVPIIIVLLFMTILFYKSFHQVKHSLIQHYGQFSTTERQKLEYVQFKFIIIISTFVVCWMPTMMNGLFISVVMDERSFTWVLLVLEAVLNPCQVVVDSLVIYGWPTGCMGMFRSRDPGTTVSWSRALLEETENDALLSFSRNRRTL